MASDYKQKLEKYIADIPAISGEIQSGAKCAAADFEKLRNAAATDKKLKDKDKTATKAAISELQPGYPTDEKFMKYTGTAHLTLLANWAGGGQMTTCNGLAGNCGKIMGAKDFLGQFELEALLQKSGKGHAWVSSKSGKRPDYGDIFRSESLHMGVSLGFKGDKWLTVESGQGGPSSGYDIIMRKEREFNPNSLKGWCDMWFYLDSRPPLPEWLVGTWIIYCGGQNFTYRLTKHYEAFFYPWKPIGNSESAVPMDTGTISFERFDSLTITWSKEGGAEKFKYDFSGSFPGIREQMTGLSSRGESLKGIRL